MLHYLFSPKLDGRSGSDVFTKQGFRSWKKVNTTKNVHFSTTIEIVLTHSITMQLKVVKTC